MATYVASAYVSLGQYLKGCAIFLILAFAIFSMFFLDFFDCITHPSTSVRNFYRTHRVHRSVRCYEEGEIHVQLLPLAFFFVLLLVCFPAFVFWQARALLRARKEDKKRRGWILEKIRRNWNFLWIGFKEESTARTSSKRYREYINF